MDRERTEVIIGRGTYVNRGNTTVIQHGIVRRLGRCGVLKQLHPEHGDDELAAIRRQLKASLPAFHAETAPGLVPNIIIGPHRQPARLDGLELRGRRGLRVVAGGASTSGCATC